MIGLPPSARPHQRSADLMIEFATVERLAAEVAGAHRQAWREPETGSPIASARRRADRWRRSRESPRRTRVEVRQPPGIIADELRIVRVRRDQRIGGCPRVEHAKTDRRGHIAGVESDADARRTLVAHRGLANLDLPVELTRLPRDRANVGLPPGAQADRREPIKDHVGSCDAAIARKIIDPDDAVGGDARKALRMPRGGGRQDDQEGGRRSAARHLTVEYTGNRLVRDVPVAARGPTG